MSNEDTAWWIYQGTGKENKIDIRDKLPPPPPWREFTKKATEEFPRLKSSLITIYKVSFLTAKNYFKFQRNAVFHPLTFSYLR